MSTSTVCYQPYAAEHAEPKGPGDARPNALQVVRDCGLGDKLKGKTVLITGCSSGIGAEIARALYSAGATIFVTARDLKKTEAVVDGIVADGPCVGQPRPVILEMDLNSLDSVQRAADEFKAASQGQLNIL
jgi:NAD(P)-dependent dehydrogenase (short-subunit alcohol dehydrogenase family)